MYAHIFRAITYCAVAWAAMQSCTRCCTPRGALRALTSCFPAAGTCSETNWIATTEGATTANSTARCIPMHQAGALCSSATSENLSGCHLRRRRPDDATRAVGCRCVARQGNAVAHVVTCEAHQTYDVAAPSATHMWRMHYASPQVHLNHLREPAARTLVCIFPRHIVPNSA